MPPKEPAGVTGYSLVRIEDLQALAFNVARIVAGDDPKYIKERLSLTRGELREKGGDAIGDDPYSDPATVYGVVLGMIEAVDAIGKAIPDYRAIGELTRRPEELSRFYNLLRDPGAFMSLEEDSVPSEYKDLEGLGLVRVRMADHTGEAPTMEVTPKGHQIRGHLEMMGYTDAEYDSD
jgi:hypothetical protein